MGAGATTFPYVPDGHTLPFASPEVLKTVLRQLAREETSIAEREVDMLAAELWSAGTVMCHMLIRQLPFEASASAALDCPAHLAPEACLTWADHYLTLQAQETWVSHSHNCHIFVAPQLTVLKIYICLVPHCIRVLSASHASHVLLAFATSMPVMQNMYYHPCDAHAEGALYPLHQLC